MYKLEIYDDLPEGAPANLYFKDKDVAMKVKQFLVLEARFIVRAVEITGRHGDEIV